MTRPGASFAYQQGQALVLGLLVLTMLSAAWGASYVLSRQTALAVRLTHVADAVAYSGALMQARQLNMLAYLQRTQVAHQVAMAHLTTLVSWAALAETQRQRRRMGNPPAFLISRLFGLAYGQAYGAAAIGNLSGSHKITDLHAALQRHDAAVHQILVQVARQQWREAVRLRDAHMQAVLRAHYLSADSPIRQVPTMQVHGDTFASMLAWQPPEHALRPTVLAAVQRFDFLQPRNFTRINGWMVQARCPTRRHQLRRRGETYLDSQGRWGADDSLSFHALRSNRWVGCYLREYPLGWAAAGPVRGLPGRDYVANPPPDFSAKSFWRWFHETSLGNPGGNFLGASYAARDRHRGPALQGLPDTLGLAGQASAQFSITLRSAAGLNDLGMSTWLGAPAGSHALPALSRRASALTYFSPPDLQPGAMGEAPSLFRPYWQARLIALPASDPALFGVKP